MVDRSAAGVSAEVFTFTDPSLKMSSRRALLNVLRGGLDALPDTPDPVRAPRVATVPSAAHRQRWSALVAGPDVREIPTQQL